MIDDDGDIYHGKMGRISTTGGDDTGSTSGSVIANFEVAGDNGLTLVGTFDGTYVAPNTEENEMNGILLDRYVRGTWYNGSGEVGNIDLAGKGD